MTNCVRSTPTKEFSVPTLRASWRVTRTTKKRSKLSKASWRRSLSDTDTNSFIKEILDKWKRYHSSTEPLATGPSLKLDVDEQLAKLLENQKLAKKVEREYTDEERRIKQQILSQYSQLSESDHEDADVDPGPSGATGGSSSDGGLIRNTNASDVAALVREKREQAKLESQQKKEKDRQDREKQKQLREEKKEKRKTVKGERRR
ncbi:coiled-coil domain-containing protein 43 isoform X2 [Malaya genurostris]|uniref:coiled-coil domain-containing protein 43 isoform X2 n=1 Tax=Malaya genurostris TaxID=325434 RepID=UPI0026F3A77A|nr:coiled-coil domain-containing protein 43 isoform X2 [Malaya genurostris]